MRRPLVASVVLVAVLVLAQASLAVGPVLPALMGASIGNAGSDVTYLVRHPAGGHTVVVERAHGHALRTTTIAGNYGLQMVAISGALAGLSPNGKVLVLSNNVNSTGRLRTQSRFAILDAKSLELQTTLTLRGEYSIDALSPDGTLLYLIHHLAAKDMTSYQVVAYDLGAGRVLPGVIADKTQAGWVMNGFPISRVTTTSGDWVYTFYQENDNYPFVHALDTADHTAVCIGIPADWVKDESFISSARLSLAGDELVISSRDGVARYSVNTKTFRVSSR